MEESSIVFTFTVNNIYNNFQLLVLLIPNNNT